MKADVLGLGSHPGQIAVELIMPGSLSRFAPKGWAHKDDKNQAMSEAILRCLREIADVGGYRSQCDGQFAAVVVDERSNRVVLTVNWPRGYHALHYCSDGGSPYFANRLDLLIHRCGWQPRVNQQAVVELLLKRQEGET